MLIIPQVQDLGESITVTSCRMGNGQLWRNGIHRSSKTSLIMALTEDAQVSCVYSMLISFFIASISKPISREGFASPHGPEELIGA